MSTPVLVDFAMLHLGYFTVLVVTALAALVALVHIFDR